MPKELGMDLGNEWALLGQEIANTSTSFRQFSRRQILVVSLNLFKTMQVCDFFSGCGSKTNYVSWNESGTEYAFRMAARNQLFPDAFV